MSTSYYNGGQGRPWPPAENYCILENLNYCKCCSIQLLWILVFSMLLALPLNCMHNSHSFWGCNLHILLKFSAILSIHAVSPALELPLVARGCIMWLPECTFQNKTIIIFSRKDSTYVTLHKHYSYSQAFGGDEISVEGRWSWASSIVKVNLSSQAF